MRAITYAQVFFCLAAATIGAVLISLGMTGCGLLPPTRLICSTAGFGDAEVQGLLPDIQAARDAGASREQVLADAATACAACATAQPPCVQTACAECFALLVEEVFAAPMDNAKTPRERG